MTVDFAVHDPEKKDGIPNPRVHFLRPIPPLRENGTWDAKRHREYVMDEHGERIKDEAGNDTFRAISTTEDIFTVM
jgi:hypothetical protein